MEIDKIQAIANVYAEYAQVKEDPRSFEEFKRLLESEGLAWDDVVEFAADTNNSYEQLRD